jgi:hypothetical protein
MKSCLRLRSLSPFLCLFAFPELLEANSPIGSYGRQIIASVLVLEAADQGEAGMRAVLHVIDNRAGGDPSRALGQVARPAAFTSLNGVTGQRHPDYSPILRRAMKDRMFPVAMELVELYCQGELGADFTGGATHYCIHPPVSWLREMTVTGTFGEHVFLREH